MTQLISSRLFQNTTTRAYHSQRTYLGYVSHAPIWAHRVQAIGGASRAFTSCKFSPDPPMKRMVRCNYFLTKPVQIDEASKQSAKNPWIVLLAIATAASTLVTQSVNEEEVNIESPAAQLDRSGDNFLKLGQYTAALECFQKALKIREKELSADHPDLAMSCNDVAVGLTFLERHAEALEYALKGLKIREKVLAEDDLDLSRSYAKVGQSLGLLGRHAEALENTQRALKIREKVLPPNDRLLQESCIEMGVHLKNLGKFKDAGEYFLKALTIEEQELSFERPGSPASYNNIGAHLCLIGWREVGLAILQRALEISASRENRSHETRYLENYIVCMNNQSNKFLCEASKQKILALYLPKLGENHSLIKELQKAGPS